MTEQYDARLAPDTIDQAGRAALVLGALAALAAVAVIVTGQV
jgi:hypothetical protein